jgi:preprotein translocase subunit SecA
MEEDMAIENRMVTRMIEKSQKRVEEFNFDIRKNLLEYDEVMDEQRKSVYSWRQKFVESRDVEEELRALVEDAVSDGAALYLDPKTPAEQWDLEGLGDWFRRKFGVSAEIPDGARSDMQAIEDHLIALARRTFQEKCEAVGKEMMLDFARTLALRTIDIKWKDHLHAMDVLKSGIGLRGWAQLDPKIEYKSEGGEMFERMLMSIAEEATDLLFRVRVEERTDRQVRGIWDASEMRHEQFRIDQYAEQQEQTADAAGGRVAVKPIRVAQKVGRNQPCPCGSGKKFKHCCGRSSG